MISRILPGKSVWLTLLKVLFLLFVTGMIAMLIPELRYDLGPKEPMVITSPKQLASVDFDRSTFVRIEGKGNFDRAFAYTSHGVSAAYFLLDPYAQRVVVRTYEKITGDWEKLDRFMGRLKRVRRMPFSRSVRGAFHDRFEVEIPDDGLFLALDDVPELSGWHVGAMIFAISLWCTLLYFFFFWRRGAGAGPAENRTWNPQSGRA